MSSYKWLFSLLIFSASWIGEQTLANNEISRPMQIMGLFVDTTSSKDISPEILLYRQNGELGGTWSYGYPNSEGKKGFPYGTFPLEDIRLGSDGSLSFHVLWHMTSPTGGWDKKRHYFSGRLINNVIEGSFTSDWPVLRPPPIRVTKISSTDFNFTERAQSRRRAALEYLSELNRVIKCQEIRNRLPASTIEVVGFWSKVDSNGEHEWGYDLVIFTIENRAYGWLEDYSGLIGDGGTKFRLHDIHINNDRIAFKADNKVEYEGILGTSQITLRNIGQTTVLLKKDIPPAEQLWKQYQSLTVNCE